jgi:hypothetical protein
MESEWFPGNVESSRKVSSSHATEHRRDYVLVKKNKNKNKEEQMKTKIAQ